MSDKPISEAAAIEFRRLYLAQPDLRSQYDKVKGALIDACEELVARKTQDSSVTTGVEK